ncbi:MAG: LysR family transcriptional regulator [Betaproteobacteria bacterium]|nr:LysR family transcriptional regulator [Betaproteobacteria bacterium]
MPKPAKPRRDASGAKRFARAGQRHALRPPRILAYVDAVVRYGSIRRAAEALHVASSALNRRILDLEEELGETLFERLPRGVRPTAAGELFASYVRRSLSELELVGSQIERLRGLVRGEVRVGAAESVAGQLLPSAISAFQSRHPGVRFHVHVGAPAALEAALAADSVDLLLTHETPQNRDITVLASVAQPFCAVMAKDHPLARQRSLRLRDCRPYPIALSDPTLAGRALIERALNRASFRLEPALVSNSVEMMKAYARESQAICFQFRTGAAHDLARGEMAAVPLVDVSLGRTQLLLAARRGRVLPIAAAEFSEQLRQSLDGA